MTKAMDGFFPEVAPAYSIGQAVTIQRWNRTKTTGRITKITNSSITTGSNHSIMYTIQADDGTHRLFEHELDAQ